MDLDKIKKAAGNTIKVISGKTDDFTPLLCRELAMLPEIEL